MQTEVTDEGCGAAAQASGAAVAALPADMGAGLSSPAGCANASRSMTLRAAAQECMVPAGAEAPGGGIGGLMAGLAQPAPGTPRGETWAKTGAWLHVKPLAWLAFRSSN